jgi:hypothetical protein
MRIDQALRVGADGAPADEYKYRIGTILTAFANAQRQTT